MMELRIRQLSDVARLNMSTSARISQALRVNDIGTAQKLAETVALATENLRSQAAASAPPQKARSQGMHQVDVWA
jgi:hypothetical protein